MNEEEEKLELQQYDKDKLIKLLIKIRRMNIELCERLERVETELIEKTSLDDLISYLGN